MRKLAARYLCISLNLLGCTLMQVGDSVQAQIVQDRTLSRPSVANRVANTTVIDGGTQRGANLFHSFRDFSVPAGHTASFNNGADIQNILTRVTGNSISRIDGEIRANGSANLFLLNPNGIRFGPNASLNIGGSFLATTADSIWFNQQDQFSARNPQDAPLLTVSTPIGLQFGNNPGRIINRSIAPVINLLDQPFLLEGEEIAGGLQVHPGQTLALIGGDLKFPGGYLFTAGGRIELGSVAGAGQVRLIAIPEGWRFDYDQISDFGDILIADGGLIDTSGYLELNPLGAGGAIHIRGGRLQLTEAAGISSITQGTGTGQSVLIQAPVVTLSGGLPDPSAPKSPFLSFIETKADANATATATAGDITILARQLNVLNGAVLGSATDGAGRAGTVRIRADEVEVRAGSPAPELRPESSLIYNQPTSDSLERARAGNLIIEVDRLRVLAGGQINTTTFGAGQAGNLIVRANDIQLDGLLLDNNGNPQPSGNGFFFPGGFFAGTEAGTTGNGGQLRVRTQRLEVTNGAVLQTTTLGSGNAGNLIVHASESIQVGGLAIASNRPFGIQASSGAGGSGDFAGATGRGGDIEIMTPTLQVQDQGTIATSSINRDAAARGAGNITIRAQTLQLDDQASLTARTASGNGGNISLQSLNLVSLRRASQISTSAGQERASGSGGNISIDAANGFVVAGSAENNDISANSFLGSGGKVSIDAQSILGLQSRSRQEIEQSISDLSQFDPQDLPTNDVTAISQTAPNLDGQITIAAPDVDPSRGLVELPSNVIDVSQQIAQSCTPSNQESGRFVVTGRGGLPLSPDEPLRERTILTPDWVALNSKPSDPAAVEQYSEVEDALGQIDAADNTTGNTSENTIVEASEFGRDTNGKIVLVAQAHPTGSIGPEMQVQCSRP